MSVFLDTSFVIALKNPKDPDHGRAVELFQEVLHGTHGIAHTTNLVFTESVTLARVRMRRYSAAVGTGRFFFAKHDDRALVRMHHLTSSQLLAAWNEFERFADKELSMVDWTSVAVARELEVDHIASFDEGFDGVFPRLA